MSEQLTLTADLRSDLDERVEKALRSLELAEREKELLRILSMHRGALSAVTSASLAEQMGLPAGEESRRVITLGVETLRLLHRIPVGASRSKPAGYFLIETRKDLDVAMGPLLGEWYAHLRLLRALAGKQRVARLFGQQMLRLDEESESRAEPRDRSEASGGVAKGPSGQDESAA